MAESVVSKLPIVGKPADSRALGLSEVEMTERGVLGGIVPLKKMEYGFGCSITRSPYTPYSIYLRRTITIWLCLPVAVPEFDSDMVKDWGLNLNEKPGNMI